MATKARRAVTLPPVFGELATCKACGKEIQFIGPYWRHTGNLQPRHIAQPLPAGQNFPESPDTVSISGIRWIGQENENGCGIAALAMLTGQGYRDVRTCHAFAGLDLDKEGISIGDIERWLTVNGYATAPLMQYYGPKATLPWPPEPFGDIHLCGVRVKESSLRGHWVIMAADGVVLDPLTPEPKRLGDYFSVGSVAAVIQYRKGF